MARTERENQTEDSPLAGYGIKGLDNTSLSTGLAGIAGVLITFALGGTVFWLARHTKARSGPAGASHGRSEAESVGQKPWPAASPAEPADDASAG
jgi:cobalt/nickel transport protein